MRTVLLLAAMCGVCLPLSLQKLQQRKKREITETQDNITVTDLISEVNNNKGPIFFEKYVIQDMDIAHRIQRINNGCPKDICVWGKSNDGNVYVPYVISSNYNVNEAQVIQSAMTDIESLTCIRFIKQTSEVDYLSYQPKDGCWSTIGRTGGEQTVSLDTAGCVWKGIAIHESLHALGLNHEHSRNDRDKYVNVLWDNIQDGFAYAFKEIDTLNVDLSVYDYGSIMHYSRYSFTKNGRPTLEGIPDNSVSFGQRVAMSSLDIIKINTLYNCSTQSALTSSHGQINTMTTPTTTTSTTRTTSTTAPPTTTQTTTITPTTTTTTTTPSTTRTTTTTRTKTSLTNTIKPPTTTQTTTITPTTTTTTTTTTTPSTTRTTTTTRTQTRLTNTIKPPTTTPTTTRTTTTATLPVTRTTTTVPPTTTKTTRATTTTAMPNLVITNACGGLLTAPQGVITSPNFPNNYPNNAFCHWIITTTSKFKITFTDFDVNGDMNKDCSDKLQIYNAKYFFAEYLNVFCGQTLPPSITSQGNTMHIIFTSESTDSSRGFRLEYGPA